MTFPLKNIHSSVSILILEKKKRAENVDDDFPLSRINASEFPRSPLITAFN